MATLSPLFVSKEEYLIKKHVGRTVVSVQLKDVEPKYPVIFGGFVRDMFLHAHGAQTYAMNGGSFDPEQYQDKNIDPATYEHRMKVPSDIDVYIPNLKDFEEKVVPVLLQIPGVSIENTIDGTFLRRIEGYSHHPLFINYYTVHTCTFVYCFGRSMQNKGVELKIRMDVISDSKPQLRTGVGPFHTICDMACNLLYISWCEETKSICQIRVGRAAVIHNFSCNTLFEESLCIKRILDDLLQNKTEISPACQFFMNPPEEGCKILQNILTRMHENAGCKSIECCLKFENPGEDMMEGVTQYYIRKHFVTRLMKQQIEKRMYVSNSPLHVYTYITPEESAEECNNECTCCISHETFRTGDTLIRFKNSKVYMKISSFYRLLDSPSNIFYKAMKEWKLLCVVSQVETDIFVSHKFNHLP